MDIIFYGSFLLFKQGTNMIQKGLYLATLTVFSSLSTSVMADDYQHDGNVTYYDQTESSSDGTFKVDYRYHFSPISDANKPYLLADYLGQTSNIGGHYSGIGNDFDQYDISGEYVFDSKWFIKAQYANFEADTGFDSDIYGAALGYYFNSSSSFYLEYVRSSGGYEISDSGGFRKSDTEQDNITLGVDTYIQFDWTEGLFLSGRYIYSDYTVDSIFDMPEFTSAGSYSDNHSTAMVDADWYITNSWSVGASYFYDFDESGNDSWLLSSDYYLPIIDTIAAVFSAAKELDSDIDGFSYSIGVNGRF
ncbi:putative porin [Shewanella goraebulensis]|uniref:putative porin n=1 Tax=Shewanella goraebulensis TaxID=3050637 RepID=UPI00254EBD00|nr:putative porin [Shewanella goraebulensis]